MNINDALNDAERAFRQRGIPAPRLDAEVLLSHTFAADRGFLYRHGGREMKEDEAEAFAALAARRCAHEPVAYILGSKEFWSLSFEVDDRVLIPRPETEVVVEEVLRIAGEAGKNGIDILDAGAGSGAIGIALAAELPRAAITALDISFPALLTARRNARTHGVEGRMCFVCGNLCEPLGGKFDIVVSNPPYIADKDYEALPEDVRKHEPRRALVAGPEGTEFHAVLIRQGVSALKRGGWLVLEMGAGQERDIEGMFAASGLFGGSRCREDYAGIPRVIMAQRKDA